MNDSRHVNTFFSVRQRVHSQFLEVGCVKKHNFVAASNFTVIKILFFRQNKEYDIVKLQPNNPIKGKISNKRYRSRCPIFWNYCAKRFLAKFIILLHSSVSSNITNTVVRSSHSSLGKSSFLKKARGRKGGKGKGKLSPQRRSLAATHFDR